MSLIDIRRQLSDSNKRLVKLHKRLFLNLTPKARTSIRNSFIKEGEYNKYLEKELTKATGRIDTNI